MAEVYFYHLTRSAAEAALAQLLRRSLQAGWRVAVRGRDAARMDWLDERLWLGAEEDFLPHGRAGQPHAARQPVLLTTAMAAENSPDCLMCLDGAELDPAEIGGLKRACVIFDGNDQDALNLARGQWKALTGAGCGAQYWSEESGRWEKKAERPAG
ncbi:DNA polymerase III subunit chi [Pseudooceanicola aestuarii]|uniref:DNA polymerase III subunit chi n=1 Tax=Pseudooceanicola aestuarii TaxID=2697319 RepID=UPI0013D8DE92|nr:DNA polymerase III subunit chi [Pseudooceanicola aestuarii]